MRLEIVSGGESTSWYHNGWANSWKESDARTNCTLSHSIAFPSSESCIMKTVLFVRSVQCLHKYIPKMLQERLSVCSTISGHHSHNCTSRRKQVRLHLCVVVIKGWLHACINSVEFCLLLWKMRRISSKLVAHAKRQCSITISSTAQTNSASRKCAF